MPHSAENSGADTGSADGYHAPFPTPVFRNEAHLPAQEAQARPSTRLSRAHEHPRRPRRASAPSRQGPQAAHRLTVSDAPRPSRRQRRGRLSRSAEFDRVYRQGRSFGNRWLVLHAFPREDAGALAEDPRLGLSVSRKVGGAVERNLVKRLLREAFTTESAALPAGLDVVVVARPDARELAERDGLAGVQAALAELIARVAGSSDAQDAA